MIRQTIVVGVDQSAQSRAALQWAADYARLIGAALHVVSVHPHWRPALPYAVGVAGVPLSNDAAWMDQAHAAIQDLFESTRPQPDWTLTQIDGTPGPELVRSARDAALLVVGPREHTGLDRFLEGSASHYCLRHAQVPVVAVPIPEAVVTETVRAEGTAVAEEAVIERTIAQSPAD